MSDLTDKSANKPELILLHGIYMNPMILKYLQNQLKNDYNTHLFGYKSVTNHITDNAQTLIDFIAEKSINSPHLIGHSLGGLVIRKAFALNPSLTTGRVVTIGTPHQGSAVARVLQSLSTRILGKAYSDALDGDLPTWQADTEIGSIAGNLSIGFSAFITLEKPNDGTVTVKETRFDGMSDHIILPASHTSLLYSKRTCKQADHFLRHGEFMHEDLT